MSDMEIVEQRRRGFRLITCSPSRVRTGTRCEPDKTTVYRQGILSALESSGCVLSDLRSASDGAE